MKRFLIKGTHITIGMHMVGEYKAVSVAAARQMFIRDFGADFFLHVKEIH